MRLLPVYLRPSIVAFLLFFALDTAVFRSGFYARYIEPNSCAGMFQTRLLQAKYKTANSSHLIAFLGDSRMSEGFSSMMFDEKSVEKTGYQSINLSMPGSTPRVWYYLLEQTDKTADAFEAIVIPLSSYSLKSIDDDPINRREDLNFLLPMANAQELFSAASTYEEPELMREAAWGGVLRMWSFHEDLRAFLTNPLKRLKDVKEHRLCVNFGDYAYGGHDGSLSEVICAGKKLLSVPPSIPAYVRTGIQKQFAEVDKTEATPQQLKYHEYWLAQIAQRYAHSRTKLIVVRIPTDPFLAAYQKQNVAAPLAKLRNQKNVFILSANQFSHLEKPNYFFDDLHLNRSGRELFSKGITAKVIELMPPIKVSYGG